MKAILDDAKVNCRHFAVFKACDLKGDIEKLDIKSEKATTPSIGMVIMYPPIKISFIKKAVTYFSQKSTRDQKQRTHQCLKLIEFGIGSTLLTLKDEYYEYQNGQGKEQHRLTIGRYESTFLDNLVASYLFTPYQGIRLVHRSKHMTSENQACMCLYFSIFQACANHV